jgi:hypothetical protein
MNYSALKVKLGPKNLVTRVHFVFFSGSIKANRRLKPIYIYMRKLRELKQGSQVVPPPPGFHDPLKMEQ